MARRPAVRPHVCARRAWRVGSGPHARRSVGPDASGERKRHEAAGKRRVRATVSGCGIGATRCARAARADRRRTCARPRRALAGAAKRSRAAWADAYVQAQHAARSTGRPNGRPSATSFDFGCCCIGCSTSPWWRPFELKCGRRAARSDHPVGTRLAELRAASSSPQFCDGAASGGRCIASHRSTHLKFSSRVRLEESLFNGPAARAMAVPTMPEHYKREPAEPGAVHDTKET